MPILISHRRCLKLCRATHRLTLSGELWQESKWIYYSSYQLKLALSFTGHALPKSIQSTFTNIMCCQYKGWSKYRIQHIRFKHLLSKKALSFPQNISKWTSPAKHSNLHPEHKLFLTRGQQCVSKFIVYWGVIMYRNKMKNCDYWD